MLRPLRIPYDPETGLPSGKNLDHSPPLTDAELEASGHMARFREGELHSEQDHQISIAKAAIERDALLRAADAIAARNTK